MNVLFPFEDVRVCNSWFTWTLLKEDEMAVIVSFSDYNKYNIWHDDSFQGVKKMGYHGTIAKIMLSAIKRGFEVAAILNRKLNWYFLKNGWYK